jgi:hypothetical protein
MERRGDIPGDRFGPELAAAKKDRGIGSGQGHMYGLFTAVRRRRSQLEERNDTAVASPAQHKRSGPF